MTALQTKDTHPSHHLALLLLGTAFRHELVSPYWHRCSRVVLRPEGLLCRAAVLRQEEAAGQIMGLLMGLDAVRFLLLVDPSPQHEPAAAPVGLIGGLRQYLPQPWARQEQARGGYSSAEHLAPHASATLVSFRLCKLIVASSSHSSFDGPDRLPEDAERPLL